MGVVALVVFGPKGLAEVCDCSQGIPLLKCPCQQAHWPAVQLWTSQCRQLRTMHDIHVCLHTHYLAMTDLAGTVASLC